MIVENLNTLFSNNFNWFQLLSGCYEKKKKERDDKILILPQYCDDTKDGW